MGNHQSKKFKSRQREDSLNPSASIHSIDSNLPIIQSNDQSISHSSHHQTHSASIVNGARTSSPKKLNLSSSTTNTSTSTSTSASISTTTLSGSAPASQNQSQSLHSFNNSNQSAIQSISNLNSNSIPSSTTNSISNIDPSNQTILSNPSIDPSNSFRFNSNLNSINLQNGNLSSNQSIDIDELINRLLEVGYSTKLSKSVCLKNHEIINISLAVREILLNQPTLIELSPPVKIVGDVHGQFNDLIRLFEMCGFPPNSNYLFLGDYVDRGKQSLETILLLFCYKIKYPENFFLLRGNHECANVTRVYGFYDECKRRCNIKIWKTFIDVFNCLPISAIVASKIFCVHGGLSPSLTTMDDIRKIQRPTDVPDYGLLNDLLWSDPSDTAIDWEDNERGVSYCFGKSVIAEFLSRYDFDLICRAHMVVEDGYEFWNERTLVTIFSAPNYCGEFDNFGAVMSVSEDLLCAFELLKPLDGAALKKEMQRKKRQSILGSSQGGS
ncbi:hypothetical protein O181_059286 [Austropuccinia psidii MF-1]|uniref:Serine/threonine-protein phosphatase n=1 Tax=Austropuccinia psidii MF-1 TaxID=1389203 RepID=A0A9Q3EBX6_9BASI|nr:hypothetical protein [Austropuccinia psidii MF-1]